MAAAQKRHARRHHRAMSIWSQYRAYYGRQPKGGAKWWLHEEWDDRSRCWSYERAYALEIEAAILLNRLALLLAH
jgi:hypothetical protein